MHLNVFETEEYFWISFPEIRLTLHVPPERGSFTLVAQLNLFWSFLNWLELQLRFSVEYEAISLSLS